MVEKTRDDLVREVSALRGRLAELERSKAEFGQAKRALKESEDRFWSLFGGAVEGILVVDIETLQVRYANPAICRMLGYSEEELAKLRVHDIHHEEDLRDVASAFEAQVRGEKPLATGIPFLRKDGTKVYADINSSKIIVDERACNVGFVTDITDRKKAERAQRESEELFRFLFQSTEDCVVIVDRDLKYIHANKASNDYLGYRDDTIEGKTIDEAMAAVPELKDLWVGRLSRYFETGEPSRVEDRLEMNGETTWSEASLSAIRNSAGDVLAVGIIYRDITERKRAEEALRESEERYRLLADNASDVIWIRDKDMKTIYISPSIEKLRGYTVEEAMDQTLEDVLTPESAEIATKGIAEELAREMSMDEGDKDLTRSRAIELEMKCKDGSTIWVDMMVNFMRDESGMPKGLLGITRDITERKRADEVRGQLEKQLRQAQKMEAIGTLAGGIAHDFNNILQSMIGYADLARGDVPAGSEAGTCLEEVISSGARAAELVEQLLAFSRHFEPKRRPAKIEAVIIEAMSVLASSVPSTIEVRLDTDDDCGTVLCDPTRIHQVVINLCTNALHAMRGRRGILEVKLGIVEITDAEAAINAELETGSYSKLSVRDTGTGMDGALMRRIFDPFYTTKEVGEGTGMGLATAHGIVKSERGAILVESEPGKGSTFHVYLPLITGRS